MNTVATLGANWTNNEREFHRKILAEHVCKVRGVRYDCVCVQCVRIRTALDIPAPAGRTTR